MHPTRTPGSETVQVPGRRSRDRERRARSIRRTPSLRRFHPAVPRNRNPGQGPKGRRSGTQSPRSGVKIAIRCSVVRQVEMGVGPGSPAGDPMRDLFPFREIWVDAMRERSSCRDIWVDASRDVRSSRRIPGIFGKRYNPPAASRPSQHPRSRNPGQGPKGRRSGTHSPSSGLKIPCENIPLRPVTRRVGPGSPLALRPGMRTAGSNANDARPFCHPVCLAISPVLPVTPSRHPARPAIPPVAPDPPVTPDPPQHRQLGRCAQRV